MRRLFLAATMLLAVVFARAQESPGSREQTETLEQLVQRLSHPIYAQRRDAQRRLLSRGLPAFDALRAGLEATDPEVSDACRGLLSRLTADWVWGGESDRARTVLIRYGTVADEEERVGLIEVLGRLPYQEGVESLVRIARFDSTDRVAREAARELIAPDDHRVDPRRAAALFEAVTRADAVHGVGMRPAAEWIRLAAQEWSGDLTPAEAAAAWAGYADAARSELRRGRGRVTPGVLAALLRRGLRNALQLDNDQLSSDLVRPLIEVFPDSAEERAIESLRAAVDASAWATAKRLAVDHADLLTGKRGQYTLAELAEGAGEVDEARRLVESASKASVVFGTGTPAFRRFGPSVVVASDLIKRGRDDWAEAEYRAAFESADLFGGLAVMARWALADEQFEAARYAESAETLRPLHEALNLGTELYLKLPRVEQGIAPSVALIRARYHSATALAARERGDQPTEIDALEKALRADGGDADILIAMHRVVDPPEEFAQRTRQRIQRLKTRLESNIWDNLNANGSTDRAVAFNHWAWLVSNTTGDYDKAVRYSRRSLEIMPETAGFLDTLGRCLYSAGDLDEAVRVQRRAVELDPHTKVLRRQLEEFEAALAKRDAE